MLGFAGEIDKRKSGMRFTTTVSRFLQIALRSLMTSYVVVTKGVRV